MFETNRVYEKDGQLIVPYGTKDGMTFCADFASIPSLLISGTTGSGKTLFVQSLLVEMIQKYTPKELRLMIYDSKQIDYNLFGDSPYCLIPIVHDPKKCENMISWLVVEIQHRLDNIADISKMPHIIAIVDDCSEIMERGTCYDNLLRIMQLARQVKIHCWLVTYNPSADMIPVNLRMVIHSRVAFHLTTKSMSRAVLDSTGAETLRVPGEMIFKHIAELNRCEAVSFSEQELVVKMREAYSRLESYKVEPTVVEVHKEIRSQAINDGTDENGRDEYFAQAGRFIIEKDKASIGMIQRVFKLGFNRAARIMDQLSEAGVVGPEEGVKPRKILMDADEFEAFLRSGTPANELRESKRTLHKQNELPKSVTPQNKEYVSQIPNIWLTPQESIKGINATIEAKRECIVVRDNKSDLVVFVASGIMIERLLCKEPRLFSPGSITVVDKGGESVTVTFKMSDAKNFFRFLRQLAKDTNRRIEL